MNRRKLNLQKYGISGKRYKELCGFCEQFPEWKAQLKNASIVKSPIISDMPKSPNHNSDNTGELAIKLADYRHKCELIENTAKQASPDLWHFLIRNICYEVPVTYLIDLEGLPLSPRAFCDLRRYFFYLLDNNKK